MDTVINSAIEEICCETSDGLHIRELWPKLKPSLASIGCSLNENVKREVWESLVEIGGLKFVAVDGTVSCDSAEDWSQVRVEECEEKNVKIVASAAMWKSFLGIYDLEASGYEVSDKQLLILRRLAVARTNGIAQNELAKELRMKANNFFFPLKRLEVLNLIVRLPAMIRKKQASSSRDPNMDSLVHTNMLFLYRYGKQLSSQQRLEIRKEDNLLLDKEEGYAHAETGNDIGEVIEKKDVHVKDYLPAMEAICAKLDNAPGKVLVVSDIKRDLGYRLADGHRTWRNIYHRLKDAQLVEECQTMVNKKMVSCLRLLKKFSPSHFEQKNHGRGRDDIDMEQCAISVKRGQITEQLVELPILRQIYDTIDASGTKGLTNQEVYKALGLCKNQKRYFDQIERFGLNSEQEIHNKSEVYRLYTAGNFKIKSSNTAVAEREALPKEVTEPNSPVLDLEFQGGPSQPMPMQLDTSTSMQGTKNSENDALTVRKGSNDVNDDVEGGNVPLLQWRQQAELCNDVHDEELLPVTKSVTNNTELETRPSTVFTPPRLRSYKRYHNVTASAPGSLREQRILKMLQEEKFLLKPDLHRRLESLQKEKTTEMDRKTLNRCLNKLQQEGHCKCIDVHIPVLTNCSQSKKIAVVLHPSVSNISTEFLGQIHDKLRNFEFQLRKQQVYSQRIKGQSVAILDSVHRISNSMRVDVQSERAKLMRANGYVLAKMVRAKLLHVFLWGWVCSSPGQDDALFTYSYDCDLKNPHSTCKKFELDVAIKSMPLELFLQVVGSTQKFDDMVGKCRSGLQLSKLPIEEYKCLMDTRASARLSWLIDILRRLKLIRLVGEGYTEDQASSSDTTLIHALELKPYIEEPVSTASSGFLYPDLRPQARHDFVLSSREAVDEYWNTLEYSYAAANSRAALHAFPGSAVHEVFHSRSWASVRVMTADQRSELLKRVATDEPNKKLSFRECDEIAKDLNLTLEQVVRVYDDKRRPPRNRFQRISDAEEEEIQPNPGNHTISPHKRKRNSGGITSNTKKAKAVDGQSSMETVSSLFGRDKKSNEEQQFGVTASDDFDDQLRRHDIGDCMEDPEDPELNEEDKETYTSIHNGLSRLHQKRKKRFSWTEEADRKLVIEYARSRAVGGADNNRVDWGSILNLPAHPNTCRRRIALLNSYIPFRKSMMKLCGMLGERYAKYLEIFPDKKLNHDGSEKMVRDYSFEGDSRIHAPTSWKWDDFDDNNIKVSLDNVLMHKRMAKLEAAKDTISNHVLKVNGRRSRLRKLPEKYAKLLNKGAIVAQRMHESVAIANAAELCKLIFLSTLIAPEVPTLLAETLRRYSQHDLFSAFNYFKEKKFMIGGSGNPFGLSQEFRQSIELSTFPGNTGKRAAMFASWLQEREKKMMEEGIDVPSDLQCGEVFTLCALVSSGELLITPCLPDEGVGEAEDNKTSKSKCADGEPDSEEVSNILKNSFAGDSEFTTRREKGFPGITLSLHRQRISRLLAIESPKDICKHPTPLSDGEDQSTLSGREDQLTLSGMNVDCAQPHSGAAEYIKEILDSEGSKHLSVDMTESPWEAMTTYARYVMSSCSYKVNISFLHPHLFKTLCSSIQKSGDQGLSMIEIGKLLNIEDENLLELVVEVLETFGRALKVNSYDSIHIVDSLYRSKYFLNSVYNPAATHLKSRKRKYQDVQIPISHDDHANSGDGSEKETNTSSDVMHRVTILNQPEDVADLPKVISKDKRTGYKHSEGGHSLINREVGHVKPCFLDTPTCRPLLPWLNGDGTINRLVYSKLRRRILGLVMQNPGILEDRIINKMPCLNPQSCRKLLEIMIMDNDIITRKMHQMTSTQPPSILGNLLGDHFSKPKLICQVHYFANPMSTSSL